jgi:hypothetical protein
MEGQRVARTVKRMPNAEHMTERVVRPGNSRETWPEPRRSPPALAGVPTRAGPFDERSRSMRRSRRRLPPIAEDEVS